MRAVFLDKDGTLVKNVPYNVDPELVQLTPLAGAALRAFQRRGYALLLVSNQPGIAKGIFPEAALHGIQQRLVELLSEQGVALRGFYYCPHHPDSVVKQYGISCLCRKPQPGMIYRAAYQHGIDLKNSWMIGDILDDVEAGRRAGCRTVLINNGNETEWELSGQRTPDVIEPDLLAAAQTIEKIDGLRDLPLSRRYWENFP
jgi:D-glycero-D-manno-heptose 1,7-bisphosphate phosphatase